MQQPLPVLSHRFKPQEHYERRRGGYSLLPLRFISLDRDRYILTNLAGEHIILHKRSLHELIRHELSVDNPAYDRLKSRHFFTDGDSTVALDLLAAKYRTKQAFLSNFTSLFMFVTTLRCDHSCQYCQVSRQSQDKHKYDMTREMADRAIDFMFQTPSPAIKVEFQGGESLLNFDLVEYIVHEVKARNAAEQRNVAFVITTNLAPLMDHHLDFCREHDIHISTSLDGPRELHNRNRPRPGGDSYERTIDGIRRVREALGHDRVAALMTTTEASLSQPAEIIDEYVRQGFVSIFLRSLNPYGYAAKSGLAARYSPEDWLNFYRRGLAHILDLNYRGVPFREEYSAIILRKILTPYATGYVDLQSPAGIGISGIVFNYDGDVYASDEARMLAEMGDKTFRLGSLMSDSHRDIMLSDALLRPLRETMVEGMPMCSDCGVQPYCGSDPVRHHRVQGDIIGHKPTSDHCRKNMGVIKHLIRLLEDDGRAAEVLRSWAWG